MWQIGNVVIKNQVCLAPMAGICNSAFRKIIKEMGAGLIFCEMVSDKAVAHGNKKTQEMLMMEEVERPIVQQIFGSDIESFVIAAKYIESTMNPDIIDINMGCPVKKVAIKSQAGSFLMKDAKNVEKIVTAVVNSVKCPVTVKIRSGWDEENINAVEIAKACERGGASAITVHPRTRNQGYAGFADWSVIKDVKENVSVPVIGNGDIKKPEDASKMLAETNCDAVMIGRAAMQNPLIIRDVVNHLQGIVTIPYSAEENIEIAKRHFEYLKQLKPEKVVVLEFKMHLSNYVKKFEDAKKIRQMIMAFKTAEDFENFFENVNIN